MLDGPESAEMIVWVSDGHGIVSSWEVGSAIVKALGWFALVVISSWLVCLANEAHCDGNVGQCSGA